MGKFEKGNIANPNGRPKGIANKRNEKIKCFITNLLEENQERIKEDLEYIEPKERLAFLEKLMAYVVPKQQAISIEAQMEAEYKEIRATLESAPDEFVERIAMRVLTLNAKNKSKDKEDEQVR